MINGEETILFLLTTDGCHLCDVAKNEIKLAGLIEQIEEIDIAEDDQLIELYGTKIPVLINKKQQGLYWPFNAEQINQFYLS